MWKGNNCVRREVVCSFSASYRFFFFANDREGILCRENRVALELACFDLSCVYVQRVYTYVCIRVSVCTCV